jgi:hypothetical protein
MRMKFGFSLVFYSIWVFIKSLTIKSTGRQLKLDKDGPQHTISKHISLNRYENLHRYLYISPPETSEEPQELLDNEDNY